MAKKRTNSKSNGKPHNIDSIYGLIGIAVSLLLFVFLFTQSTGVIGSYSVIVLQFLFGKGRFLLPFAVLIWAIDLLFRKDQEGYFGYGVLLCFLSIVAMQQVSTDLEMMFSANAQGGGLVGGALAYIFKYLLGSIGAYIILAASFIIGLIVATRTSIGELARNISHLNHTLLSKIKNKERPVEKPQLKEINNNKTSVIKPRVMQHLTKATLATVMEDDEDATTKPTEIVELPNGDENYQLPPLSLLKMSAPTKSGSAKKDLKENIKILEKTLSDFDVDAGVSKVVTGPTVTRYEVNLASGVKVNRLLGLADDIAYAFASPDVRILAPIPGKSAIGIEVPNQHRQLVTLGDLLNSQEFISLKGSLVTAIGKDITGKPVFADLCGMPHLLIAGATGSGKSVCINSILTTLLCRARPDQVKLILIDPKRVELTFFNNIPHLITPVITSPKNAANALAWAVAEMERRYELLCQVGVKHITSYNALAKKPEGEDEHMPYIMVVIDELADLMMVAPREVEDAICRLAQLARAVGIHLVIATQRPSTDVITGLIKANIVTRIAFAVSSMTDSRVILDTGGAEKLIGKGDLLFSTQESMKPTRLQAAYVSEKEIESITEFIKQQSQPEFVNEVVTPTKSNLGFDDYEDDLMDEAIDIVVRSGKASVSNLQRRLRIGYGRAARIMDALEERGIVSEQDASKQREILVSVEELEEMKERDTFVG